MPCLTGTTVPPPGTPPPISVYQHGHTVPSHTTVPPPPNPKTTTPHSEAIIMSTSLTPEQVAEQALKEKAKHKAQLKDVETKLGQLMEEKRRSFWSSRSSSKHLNSDDFEGSNPVGNSSDEEYERRPRRHQGQRE